MQRICKYLSTQFVLKQYSCCHPSAFFNFSFLPTIHEKESLELYYKIDNQKKKELETAFNQKKLKIKFDDMTRYLKKEVQSHV